MAGVESEEKSEKMLKGVAQEHGERVRQEVAGCDEGPCQIVQAGLRDGPDTQKNP